MSRSLTLAAVVFAGCCLSGAVAGVMVNRSHLPAAPGCTTDSDCAARYPGTNGGPEPLSPAVLVGLGCEGPDPVAVAFEEDRLPRCLTIERHALH